MKIKGVVRAPVQLFLSTPSDAAAYSHLCALRMRRMAESIRTMVGIGYNSMMGIDGVALEYFLIARNLIAESRVDVGSLNLMADCSDDSALIELLYKENDKKTRPFIVRTLVVAGYLFLHPAEYAQKRMLIDTTGRPLQRAKVNAGKLPTEDVETLSPVNNVEAQKDSAADSIKPKANDKPTNANQGLLNYDDD